MQEWAVTLNLILIIITLVLVLIGIILAIIGFLNDEHPDLILVPLVLLLIIVIMWTIWGLLDCFDQLGKWYWIRSSYEQVN